MKDFVIFIVLIIFGVFTQAKVTCPDIACMLGSGDGCINTAETDENGCTRCVCQPFPACPDLICPDIYCDYGKEVVDGCETCQCKLAPVTCPDIACMLGNGDGCINTAETDENGCTRCVCQPFPACPDLICPDIYCDYGKEVVDGCETCQCKLAPVTCPDIACMLGNGDGCINTAETDENGCTRCVCQPFPACPDLICPDIYCDYGKEVVDGCETCQCKLAPVTCPDIACMLGSGDGCINTAETDENGCTRCVCQPFPACPDLICPDIYCDYGKEVVDGCETCQCKLAPECLLLDCNTACLYGNVIDKTGCKTCECTNPCKDVLCLAPQVCVPDSNSPGKYRCVSQETQCCPKVHPPLHRSVQNVCQNCFLDCSTMKCAPGYSCCPDWNGCHSCVKSVPCF